MHDRCQTCGLQRIARHAVGAGAGQRTETARIAGHGANLMPAGQELGC